MLVLLLSGFGLWVVNANPYCPKLHQLISILDCIDSGWPESLRTCHTENAYPQALLITKGAP